MHSSNGSAQREIIDGLSRAKACVSPKYFYDALGCRLFEIITHLPEYYPTRTEQRVMRRHAAEIAEAVGTGATLIDLGAGNCAKARTLFPSIKPQQYVAVDISTEFMNGALSELHKLFPEIDMLAVGADLSAGLALPPTVLAASRVFFYPGSSIGNFDPPDALALLSNVRQLCSQRGGLLIGVDLIKERAILEAAYDDELGITAAFNLNLLSHLNRLIDSDFRLRDWRHRAIYSRAGSRIEMHLEAFDEVAVAWRGGGRRFSRGERIHTENSYKYLLGDFKDLLAQAGFSQSRVWTDDRQWFAVFYASV